MTKTKKTIRRSIAIVALGSVALSAYGVVNAAPSNALTANQVKTQDKAHASWAGNVRG